MIDQTAKVQAMCQELRKQVERLREMYEELFSIENGEKVLKSHITSQKLIRIKEALTQILSIYNENILMLKSFNSDKDEFEKQVMKTKRDLFTFSKENNVELPNILKNLYNL